MWAWVGVLSIRHGPKVLGWWLQAMGWMGETPAIAGFHTWTKGARCKSSKAGLLVVARGSPTARLASCRNTGRRDLSPGNMGCKWKTRARLLQGPASCVAC
ncbi:hypothetical protein FF2_029637 [Malus domestica]